MGIKRKQLFPQMKGFVHGGDYNPEQWLDRPDILEKDVELMKKAGVNSVSVGIFSWSTLEPTEGEFHLDWLRKIIDRLYENGIYTVLATPSGARPAWLAQKYPEVLRVSDTGVRNHFGARHNHCLTSEVYREKVAIIDRKLAEEFGHHPGVILWHISNELQGQCYCPNCIKNFRNYLRKKYDHDIQKLNHAWWNTFWSHDFNDFEQIEPPFVNGERTNMSLLLEWRRYSSFEMTNFMKSEIQVLREVNPDIPITTNFMELFEDYDYNKMAKEIDVVSWDCYPRFHNDYESFADTMAWSAFNHALMRSFKPEQPFMMMESAPGLVNWHPVNKLKRPGVHKLACFQAVASGSDSVQYFQWRKGRGSFEQYHGAVVDHDGSDQHRVFKEVAEVGRLLEKVSEVSGSVTDSKVGIVFDWDSRWALKEVRALADQTKQYEKQIMDLHKTLLRMGVDADIICQESDWERYSVIFAPMMYILHEGTAQKAKSFVEQGGQLLMTYFSAYVNEDQLCFLGGFPGEGLQELFGITAQEIDTFYPKDVNRVDFNELAGTISNGAEKTGTISVEVRDYAEILGVTDATVLGTYGSDFYANTPAMTVKAYGKGKAYYQAARMKPENLKFLYMKMLEEAGVSYQMLPEGIEYHQRKYQDEAGQISTYDFYLNVTEKENSISGIEGKALMEETTLCNGELRLPAYGVEIIKRD